MRSGHLILHWRHGSVEAPVPLVGQSGRAAAHFGSGVGEWRRAEGQRVGRLALSSWRGAIAAQRAQLRGSAIREMVHCEPVFVLPPVRRMDISANEHMLFTQPTKLGFIINRTVYYEYNVSA